MSADFYGSLFSISRKRLKAACDNYLIRHMKALLASLGVSAKLDSQTQPIDELISLALDQALAKLKNQLNAMRAASSIREEEQAFKVPVATELHNILNQLIDQAKNMPADIFARDKDLKALYRTIKNDYPKLSGDIQRILAVEKLSEPLNESPLVDREAIIRCERLLKKSENLAILIKDQEPGENFALKLLSVISILCIVGIFTTAALMYKKWRESGGATCNFFKPQPPLKEELCQIIDEVKMGIYNKIK